MKSIKLEAWFYVPDEITDRELTHSIAYGSQSQVMHELAANVSRDLNASEPIQWCGFVYEPKRPDHPSQETPATFAYGVLQNDE